MFLLTEIQPSPSWELHHICPSVSKRGNSRAAVSMTGLGCWGSEHGDPSAVHVTRTRGRSCGAPLQSNLLFPFCTPVSRASLSAHTCSWQDLTPSRRAARGTPRSVLAALHVICLSSVTWAGAWRTRRSNISRQGGWEEKKKTKLPRGRAEGGRCTGQKSRVQVQDNQNLSQWFSTLGHVAVSGDVFGYHAGGAPGIYWHQGMLFNFSNAQDSPP